MKCDELFKECLSKVDPEIRAEVRKNMEAKIIEERAKEYTYRYATPFLSGFERAEFEAYKCGAEEQKRIDIEKACAWLEFHWTPASYHDHTTYVDDFRKAMEE